jgi:Spy/CpxP family protein refolding chaperone
MHHPTPKEAPVKKLVYLAVAAGLAACAHEPPPEPNSPEMHTTSAVVANPAPAPPPPAAEVPGVQTYDSPFIPVAPERAPAQPAPPGSGVSTDAWRASLFDAALEITTLTTEQRAEIRALATRERAQMVDVRAARIALYAALADEVQSGNVSSSSLSLQVNALAGAIARAEPTRRESLDRLHAILTDAQRQELVRTAESQLQTSQGHEGEDPRPDLGVLAWSDDITPTQESRIRTALRTLPHPPGDARATAQNEYTNMLEAFKAPSFVMNDSMRAKSQDEIRRRVNEPVLVAEEVSPILTQPQRAAAAKTLRAEADAM